MATAKKEDDTFGNIEASPLWVDVRDIMEAKKNPTRWVFKSILHTEKEDVDLMQVMHWEENRDYAGNVGTSSHVSFNMGLGDYEYSLYPYKDHMEITMKSIPLDDKGNELKDKVTSQRFKAIFHPDKNPIVVSGKDSLQDKQTLNRAQMVTCLLELQDRPLEPLRRKMTGGTFRGITVDRLIKAALMHAGNQILVDGKPSVDGIEMDDPDNEDVQSEIVVPQGTLVSNLPTWCQEKGCGVYNSGMGTYFQRFEDKNLWFVFPFFRFNKFDTAKKKLVIFNVPNGRLNGIDKTYKVEGDVLKIISVNGSQLQDDNLNPELNRGFGFRMLNAKSVMTKPVLLNKDGEASFARNRIMTEVGHKGRKDTMQYAPVVKPTGNNFQHFSNILSSHSNFVDVMWENADPSFLFPGMAVKYVYVAHGKYVEKKGCLVGVFINRNLQGKPGTASVYTVHAQLGISLESKEETFQ